MNKGIKLYPLTFPQKSIWYIEKLYPNTCIGNISATLKIESDLNLDIMEKAVNELLKKNDALRLRFNEQNGEPIQYVSEYKPYKLSLFDFRDFPIENMYEWDSKESSKPIPSIDSPLIFFAFVKFGGNFSGLYMKLHHLITDAWSIVRLSNEIMDYYRMIESSIEIPALDNNSYLDFIESESEYLESERFQRDKQFWSTKFQDSFELTVLKSRKTKSDSLKANRKTFIIPDRLSNLIRRHCSENSTSIFTLFFSALCLYINRITNKDTITIGVPVLNRSNAKEKKTLGMYISTVPLSITIEDGIDFVTFLKRISSEWMSVLKHQKYPYDEILKIIRENNKGTEKLFDIAISYQNAKFSKDDSVDFKKGRWHFNGYQTESLNIHINDREDNSPLILNFDYLADVFYPKEIEFIYDHMIRLLWHALDNPTRILPHIHIISEVERNKILNEFNDTLVHYPKNKTVHQLFEEQTEKTPNNIAVEFGNIKYTYAELNAKANQLAHHLRENGVGPDVIVGIMMQRTPDFLTGILGIMKAGGCYLPLDPEYPRDRLMHMIKDSKTKYLLVHNETLGIVDFKGNLINISNIESNVSKEINIDNVNKPSDLIYILYTSGTTGKPKGVMIEHKSLVPLLVNDGFPFQIGETDIWALAHSFCFDVSVWEIFGALLFGGSLVIVPNDILRDPERFVRLLKHSKVTVLNQIPVSLYNLINEEMKHDKNELSLRYVIFGGESLKPILLKSFIAKYPHTKFINMYGVTETTVSDTYKELTEEEIRLTSNNIGKPLPTVNVYILDKNMNLVPIGAMGEICIGGKGLARGYLNKPKLTKERFVNNPFKVGEKLYKSGDFARWFPKGEIEYLGRIDNQVKIRGYRIELGEIEKQIVLFPGVEKTVVVAREDSYNKKFLCTYFTTSSSVSTDELKEFLGKVLPNYMMPSHYVQLESLPLTSSGKVDIKKLPEPIIRSSEIYAEPRNALEKTIADIWQKILNAKRVGIDDNFFEIGGDSLATVQFLSHLYKYDLVTQIQNIYEYPTIRALCKTITHVSHKENTLTTEEEIFDEINIETNENIKIETRPIEDLIFDGELPLIDSVALAYLPYELSFASGNSKTDILEIFDNKPVLYHSILSEVGHIGLMILPIFSNELYLNKDKLLDLSLLAINKAAELGAKTISLTGLIPSATNYGQDIFDLCAEKCPNIKVTTGHATTAASVVLSIKRILQDSNRNIENESISFIGLGSIGTAVLKLLLSVVKHPASINLCDIAEKENHLIKLKKELIEEFEFTKKNYFFCRRLKRP